MLSLTKPKSTSTTWPSQSSIMFSGLKSRYATPAACRCSKPIVHSAAMNLAHASDSLPRRSRCWYSSPPETKSVHSTTWREVKKVHRRDSKKGECTRSSTRFSSLMRDICFRCAMVAMQRTLTATTEEPPPSPRALPCALARNTCPKLPLPSTLRKRKSEMPMPSLPRNCSSSWGVLGLGLSRTGADVDPKKAGVRFLHAGTRTRVLGAARSLIRRRLS